MNCKDCIHYDVCIESGRAILEFYGEDDAINFCSYFKDASKFIELPCSIGDTVYKIYYDRGACNNCDSYADFFGLDPICDDNKILFPKIRDDKKCIVGNGRSAFR